MKSIRPVLSLACRGAILAVLAWQIAIEANALLDSSPVSFASTRAGAPETPEARLPDAFELPPAERFSEIVERPLLHPSRRPPAVPVPVASVQQDPLRATLRGLVAAGGERTALVAVEGGAGLLRLSRGDSVSGWRVEEIADGAVRLSRDGELTVLQLGFRTAGREGSLR